MSAKVKQFTLKLLSAFAAGAVMAAGSFGVAGAVTDPQVDLGNAPTGPNTLHIHKYENPAFGTTAHTGAEITNPAQQGAGGPIKNVKFKVTKTSIEFKDTRLGTEYKTAEQLKNAAIAAKTSTVSEQVTSDMGLATFSNLDNGVYLVEEVENPGVKPTINGVEVTVVKQAEPFVVILPYYINNAWNQNIHVYPKNEVSHDPTKTLVDSTNVLFPDQFNTWEIKFRLPQPQKAADPLTSLVVTDIFPDAVDAISAEVVSAKSGDAQLNGLSVSNGETDNQKKVDFANVLSQVKPGDVITLRIKAKVTKPGQVLNKFKFTYKYASGPETPSQEIPTKPQDNHEAVTLTFKKIDSKNRKPLTGATFKVCSETAKDPNGDATAQTGCREVTDTSGDNKEDGVYTVVVRWASDWTWVETAAPNGYVIKNTQAQQVNMTEDDKGDHLVEITVENDPYDSGLIPSLPITGAAGQILLTAAGLGVLFMAAGSLFVSYRRRKQED